MPRRATEVRTSFAASPQVQSQHQSPINAEVCGTAIETPMDITVRLTVLPPTPGLSAPHFTTAPPPAHSHHAHEQYHTTTGVGPDLREAARDAVRGMIAYLRATRGLSREDAYMLCSIAGDLRIHEIVDMPNYVVSDPNV